MNIFYKTESFHEVYVNQKIILYLFDRQNKLHFIRNKTKHYLQILNFSYLICFIHHFLEKHSNNGNLKVDSFINQKTK